MASTVRLQYTQIIEGSKEQFYKFLDAYNALQDHDGDERFRWIRDVRFPSVVDADIVFLWDYFNNHITQGLLKIIEIPNNRVKVIIYFDRQYYEESKHAWLLLRAALIQDGFITFDEKSPPKYLLELEKKVERHFYYGYSNKEIANSIGVSESTVKRIKKRLGLRKKKS